MRLKYIIAILLTGAITALAQYSVPNFRPEIDALESNKLNRVGPDTFTGVLTVDGNLIVVGTATVVNIYVTNIWVTSVTTGLNVTGSGVINSNLNVKGVISGPTINQLQSNIDSEISRATNEEALIRVDLTNEYTRATNAEAILQGNIDAETARATNEEAVLQGNIDAETSRATNEEALIRIDLTNEYTRATNEETLIRIDLTNEYSRATNAEEILQGNINTANQSIADEITRATNAEAVLQGNIETETSRATNQEAVLQGNIDTETARATAAEGLVQSNLNEHVAATGTNVHGLGSAAVEDASAFASAIHNQDWSTITGTPDTIDGYGITDAWTKVESDARFGTTGSVAAIEADLADHKTNTNVHAITAVTGLQDALDAKASTGDMAQAQSDIGDLQGLTNSTVYTYTPEYTDTVAKANSALQPADTNGWEVGPHLAWITNGTPGTGTNLSEYNNDLAGFATNHNDLPDLQGGGAEEYFHLTLAELAVATNPPVAGVTAGTYYDGANGAIVSGQVATLNGLTSGYNQATADASSATNHMVATTNPHAVTAAQVGAVATNDDTFLSILQSMTNYVPVESSSNYLTYDPATRLLTGCVTNAGGGGSGFPLTADGDLAGFSLTNGSFVGNGEGLTNLMASTEIIVLGTNATATSCGVAIGSSAQGAGYGTAVGGGAIGSYGGVAVGGKANGYDGGVAVGYQATGNVYGVAVGHFAFAGEHSVALGKDTFNTEMNSTMIKGNLNMQGYLVTNAPNLVYTNDVTYTTAVGQASGALPKAGGAMTGEIFYGTNRLYLGVDTNAPWIMGLGTTNILFGAGTNRAIFGAPW